MRNTLLFFSFMLMLCVWAFGNSKNLLLGQTSYARSFHPDARLSKALELNEAQEAIRNQINIDFVVQVQREYPKVPLDQRRKWLKDQTEEFNNQFKEVLDPNQRQIVDQYTFWSDVAASGNSPLREWGNERVFALLGLSQKQKSELKKIEEDLKSKIESAKEEFKNQQEKNREQLSKNAEKILMPFQKTLVINTIGPEIEFRETKLSGTMNVLGRMIKAERGSGANQSTIEFTDRSPILLLYSKSFDAPASFAALVALAADERVAEEIELNEQQKEKIETYHKIIIEFINSLPSMPGIDPNSKQVDVLKDLKNNLIPQDENDRLALLKRVIGAKNVSRLSALCNQLIVKAVSRDQIVWFHDGWVEHLQMTKNQHIDLNEAKQKFSTDEKDAITQYSKSVEQFTIESKQRAIKLLTPQQLSLWKSKVGPFGF